MIITKKTTHQLVLLVSISALISLLIQKNGDFTFLSYNTVDKKQSLLKKGEFQYVENIVAVMYKDAPVYRVNGTFKKNIGKINVLVNDSKAKILKRTDKYLLVLPFMNPSCTKIECLLNPAFLIQIDIPRKKYIFRCKGNVCFEAEKKCPSVTSTTLAIDLSTAHPDLALINSKKMTIDVNGFLYLYSKSAIYRLPTNTAVAVPFTQAILFAGDSRQAGYTDNINPIDARFNEIQDIVADKAGNLYVADGNNSLINGSDRVRKIDQQGNVTTFLRMPQGKLIRALATDNQNNIYIANYFLFTLNPPGGQIIHAYEVEILKYSSSGSQLLTAYTTTFQVSAVGNFRIPVAIAVAPAGEIYMSCLTETLYPNRFRTILLRIIPATTASGARVSQLREQREGIIQVAVASNGYVFYAMQNEATVGVITEFVRANGPEFFIGSKLEAPEQFQKDGEVCVPFQSPFRIGSSDAITTQLIEGIAISPNRDVYFSEYGQQFPNYKIRKLVFDPAFW